MFEGLILPTNNNNQRGIAKIAMKYKEGLYATER